tara:strand:+ start:89 stop:358 length:270 start_codon:yes stop_codon:yes gene_type:complete
LEPEDQVVVVTVQFQLFQVLHQQVEVEAVQHQVHERVIRVDLVVEPVEMEVGNQVDQEILLQLVQLKVFLVEQLVQELLMLVVVVAVAQ